MTYNVFGGTLNLAQFNLIMRRKYIDCKNPCKLSPKVFCVTDKESHRLINLDSPKE